MCAEFLNRKATDFRYLKGMQVKIPFKFFWKVHELHKLHLHQLQMLQQALFLHQLLKLRELQELQTAPGVPRAPGAKGQIISEQICGVLHFPNKQRNFCQDFCPIL